MAGGDAGAAQFIKGGRRIPTNWFDVGATRSEFTTLTLSLDRLGPIWNDDLLLAPLQTQIGPGNRVNQELCVRMLGISNHGLNIPRFHDRALIQNNNMIADVIGGGQIVGDIQTKYKGSPYGPGKIDFIIIFNYTRAIVPNAFSQHRIDKGVLTVKSKKYIFLLTLAILALLVAACAPQAGTGATAGSADEASTDEAAAETAAEETEAMGRGQGGTVNILYWQAASVANAYLSGGTKDIDASAIVLEPLAYFDETGALALRLGAEIPTIENGGIAEDLTSITWKLKEGVLWSDGTPLTAADAVFTWEYCTHPDTGCSQITDFDGVASVEVVDDLTIKINFDGPKPYPYNAFVGATSPLVQQAQFEECVGAAAQTCTDQNLFPIGTGP